MGDALPTISKQILPPDAMRAWQQGNVNELVNALLRDAEGEPEAAIAKLAHATIELRRESVAVLGNYEAFVRHTPEGSLHQVIRPVKLSLADGTLYQMKGRRPVCTTQSHDCYGTAVNTRNHKGPVDWRDIALGDPNRAMVTFPGYNRMNAVAGCAVGQPPTVVVDGEHRTNPYVERSKRADGRPGDITRIVIAVVVVGPAPATGNPVVVNYTLEYDPSKDLAHMLATIAENHPEDCYLANEWEVSGKKRKAGWAFLPIGNGVGFYYSLRLKEVVAAYKDYVNLQGQSLKKAQTVARRNAMKSHPALSVQAVAIDPAQGWANVPMVGWVGGERAMARWQDITNRLARGETIPDAADVEVLDVDPEIYDVESHDLADEPDASVTATRQAESASDKEMLARNALIAQIEEGLLILSPSQVESLGFVSENMTHDQLRNVIAQINNIVDEDVSR